MRHHNNKKLSILLFLILILLIHVCYATKLGISPEKIEFRGDPDNKICKVVTLYVKNYDGILVGNDKWNIDNFSQDINQYTLDAGSLNINIDYPKESKINKGDSKKVIKVCITSEKSGTYYGTLLFRAKDSYFGVGNWIFVDINGYTDEQKEVVPLEAITGSVIGSYASLNQKYITIILLISVILIVFMWFIKKEFL